jgi:hypothetical protein
MSGPPQTPLRSATESDSLFEQLLDSRNAAALSKFHLKVLQGKLRTAKPVLISFGCWGALRNGAIQ